jgi:hypothetical protein
VNLLFGAIAARLPNAGHSKSYDVSPPTSKRSSRNASPAAAIRVEDVLRPALEAQDAEESWTDEERRALCAHIEEGYLQAERGELIDGRHVCHFDL